MSEFSQLLTDSVLPVLFDLHADASRFAYAAAGGAAAPFEAMIGTEQVIESVEEPGRVNGYRRLVTVRLADVVPAINGTATVDSVAYAVRRIEESGDGYATVELYRGAVAEISRRDYRAR